MKAVKVIIVIWVLTALAVWMRAGQGFCVLDALPYAVRTERFSMDYEWLAIAAVLIGVWGYLLIPRTPRDSTAQDEFTHVPRRRFRVGLILVPAVIVILALVDQRLAFTVVFEDLVGDTALTQEHRYLAVLCLVIFAALLAIKHFRPR